MTAFEADHCSRWSGIPQDNLTDENRKHIEILCDAHCTGPHNLRVNWSKVEFGRPWTFFCLEVNAIATTDNPYLTRLVFAAHDACVRVQISSHTFRHIMIGMHSGRNREGGTMSSHPTIETALSDWRKHHDSI